MASNHYPLQAHLYLVALHRYLRWRLPGYAAERHLGGYAYVFLRGVPGPLEEFGQAESVQLDLRLTPPSPDADVPGIFLERPPLARLLALEALFAGSQEEEHR